MVEQYSSFGHTVVLYAFSLSCPEHLRIALLRKPNILLAALLMLSIYVGILTTRFAVALLQAAEVTFAVLTIVSYVIVPFTYMANHCRNS